MKQAEARGLSLKPARRLASVIVGTSWHAAPSLTAVTAAMSIAGALTNLVYPIGFRLVIDSALDHDARTAALAVALVSAAMGFNWFLTTASRARNTQLADQTRLALGERIARLVNAVPTVEHLETPAYLREIDLLRTNRVALSGAYRQLLQLIQSGVQVLGVAVLVALIYPPLVVIPLLAVLPGVADRRAARVQSDSDDLLAERRRLLDGLFAMATTSGSARELRTFGATSAVASRHRQLSEEVNAEAARAALRSAVWEASGWVLYAAGFVAAIVILVLRAAHGHSSPGEVVEATSLLRRAQRQVSTATDTAGTFANTTATAGRMLWLEDYEANATSSAHLKPPDHLREGIRLEGVSFSYPGRVEPVLSDIDIDLPAGSTVALVGENGAGKTTIVKLLTGMYRPSEGRITVDGVDLADIETKAWRTCTTATFQDHLQFQMRLGDGVGAGDLTRVNDDRSIRAAVTRAGSEEDVAEMPDGLDTLVGTYIGGRGLSGGQWQRLALARGMMRESPLLVILDEPTASLDAASEQALFERYREAALRLGPSHGAITLLVTHRFSTVRAADLIIVCHHGRVVEAGTHRQLLELQGLYAELYGIQADTYRSQSSP
jgi:ATP-binding cassette subfamily B protein